MLFGRFGFEDRDEAGSSLDAGSLVKCLDYPYATFLICLRGVIHFRTSQRG